MITLRLARCAENRNPHSWVRPVPPRSRGPSDEEEQTADRRDHPQHSDLGPTAVGGRPGSTMDVIPVSLGLVVARAPIACPG